MISEDYQRTLEEFPQYFHEKIGRFINYSPTKSKKSATIKGTGAQKYLFWIIIILQLINISNKREYVLVMLLSRYLWNIRIEWLYRTSR